MKAMNPYDDHKNTKKNCLKITFKSLKHTHTVATKV